MSGSPTLDRAGIRRMFAEPSSERSSASKVMPLEASLKKHVGPGMMLHFGYSEGRPMAISNALVRVFAGTDPRFTIVSSGLVANQGSLVTEKLVERLLVSFIGENYPTPAPNPIFQHAIDNKEVAIESQSLLVEMLNLRAHKVAQKKGMTGHG